MCRSVDLIRMLMVVMQRRSVRLHFFRHFISPRTQIFRMRRVVPLQRALKEKRFATFDETFLSLLSFLRLDRRISPNPCVRVVRSRRIPLVRRA